ncbi:class I SAM-dependent methyltransferase [Bordetella sp. LUAb4]|uniref:class I SAM-dependent methyltransferase n=1 Tax=Bordetella sp. LUAb4 TaxID=2843195 RepID=UPI001E3BF1B1|nr:class I SAM-dependent methyltransferase [Bordetella sp. LUAb4]
MLTASERSEFHAGLRRKERPNVENPSGTVHHAASGYTTVAEAYVRGRPEYPQELTDWLRDEIGLGRGARVVDLGAGTGKMTPRLLATGADVVAIEPVTQMLDKLSTTYPRVEALTGAAQAIPLADCEVDAVVCAQSFHWFAGPAALAEIHRVLKPGGRLAMLWNLSDTRVPWVAELSALINRYEGDAPRFHTGAWRDAFPYAGFGPLVERRYEHLHVGKPEDVIFNRVHSISFVAALTPERRAALDQELRHLIAHEPTLSGHEEIAVPYVTAAIRTDKLPA